MSAGTRADGATSTEEILRQRARELARPAEQQSDGGVPGLGIVAGGQRYVVPLDDVAAVVTCPPLSRVPQAPDGLLGIATLRGSLVAVFAIAPPGSRPARPAWLLVVGEGRDRMAVAVDELTGTEPLDPARWRDARRDDARSPGSHVPFVTALRDDGTALLDVRLLLSADRFTPAMDGPPGPGSEHR